ncbi:MAG: pyruvate, phosphate dikinase [Alphaproteobacteria bacterium]|nr:pyruvate, phosphate dikinase [Alphaproteobacteria bacterium]MBP9877748.1 pyruvate, phosphate dikinase [Alphaproteobacteria bacterium]
MTKWIYAFGNGKADGKKDMKDLLGGKGANLAEMASLGLPVPPGFTISTEVCTYFYNHERTYPSDLKKMVEENIQFIEKTVGATFGSNQNPLLVSVRSGARASMPGMMDTILNLGLNDKTVLGLIQMSGDERFAYDSYRRFIQMYSNVVLEVDHYLFEDALERYKADFHLHEDTDLKADDWKKLIEEYKEIVQKETGKDFPQDVQEQLWAAIGAVFNSWMNQRAITYRKLHNISADWGTAVNVQAMVFGNMGNDCATGVAFTRNPSTGENEFYGEFLINAQGEDVVAGIRTPQPLTKKAAKGTDEKSLEEEMPEVYKQLCEVRDRLETHYRDMQDIEFTVQQKKLYMLQTRNGKRTAQAALRIAVELANQNIISKNEAILRVEPASLDQLLHSRLDPKASKTVLAKGLPASPGAASGIAIFSADEAERVANLGKNVILCRLETSPEDIHGMHAAKGILTARGGMTSHAAVVARGMGRPCVSGAGDLKIDSKLCEMKVGQHVIKEGDTLTIDGSTGEVILGEIARIEPELSGEFQTLMSWADAARRLKVRANAETPTDTKMAIKFGAEGIGLCRTEHMFFDPGRIMSVREMILADNEKDRKVALEKLFPMQKQDFVEIFDLMDGRPVTIRLLDPPLHEFLPRTREEMVEYATQTGSDIVQLRQRSTQLHESNPMLGHRGCRLGISYPEIYEMQARAIFEAAVEVSQKKGNFVVPEIMIPLVGSKEEFNALKPMVERVAGEVFEKYKTKISYMIGTMIELPRAALRAGEIAETADFFSFGTNDLTQTTLGISRDDSAGFLPDYQREGIMENDPFVTLDIEGVGELISIAKDRGVATNPGLKLGICGEHGGDPASIAFCELVGLDYVSCSPYRVPIARLAAAHAALKS